jgi:hypothetical protein
MLLQDYQRKYPQVGNENDLPLALVIEEYRVGGKLFKIKVTPKIGKPYYLIDERGDGQFSRQDGPDASNMRPPQWVIHRF